MANSFYLKVISANRIFFSGRCESIVVPEFDGEKEILAHHENMVIAINRGDMRFKPEGENEWQEAVVGMGLVEIMNNRVTLLVETAERPEEIDIARAQEAKERAEEQMRQSRVFMNTIIPELLLQEQWLVSRQQVPKDNK